MKKRLIYILLKQIASRISLFLICWMLLSPCIATVYAADDPKIDWTKLPSHNGTGNVYTWSVAKGEGGYYFYIVGNQYSPGTIYVVSGDGSSADLFLNPNNPVIYLAWVEVEGATITKEVIDSNAHLKVFIPEKAFPEDGFQLKCGETVLSADIPNIADIPGTGGGENPKPTQPPTTEPSSEPTQAPATEPSSEPTQAPATEPSSEPTQPPATEPSSEPTQPPATEPGSEPTQAPATEPREPAKDPEPTPSESSQDPDPVLPADLPGSPVSYNGIVIDGEFDDWAAVSKTDVHDKDINGNLKSWSTVEHAAMVWDGDYIYLYLAADGDAYGCGNWDSVCGAGTHGNGQFAITTDLGYQLLVQPKNNNSTPTVSGIDGATVAVNNKKWDGAPHCWEIAIPASALPTYQKTISFGFYLGDPIISNVANLRGGGSGGKFEGVRIDGNYSDWTYYPHSTIEYATSGTQERVEDSTGAVYCSNGTLYAHAQTTMPQHLGEAGGEFTQSVTIKINENENLEFAPRFIMVKPNGDIIWDPPRQGLQNGRYEYRLVSLDAPGSSKNIHNLNPGDEIYGTAIVTVGNTKDQCEWEMDLAMLANHLRPHVEGTNITHLNPNDIKSVSVQWGRLGQQWVTTAGTSTGPLAGLLLCLCVAAAPAVLNRRKGK